MAKSRRSPRAALTHLFDDAATPVYAVDSKRQLVYGNPAFVRWLGVSLADLVGLRCDYGEQEVGRVACSIGVPPTTSLDFKVVAGTVARRDRAEAASSAETGTKSQSSEGEVRTATFVPISGGHSDETERLEGVIVFVGPSAVADPVATRSGSATDWHRLHQQVLEFRRRYRNAYAMERLIGSSPAVQLVRDRVALATHSPTRVVVTGPAGTGREHVARTIHYQTRDDRLPPLVPLDCELLDAELLQTTVTAFLQQCAELQIDGIPCLLLLDVDQLSTDAQDVLFEFLSIDEFELRTVATARVPLNEVTDGGFRSDVAAMLSTLTIQLPSLNERLEDIPLLVQHALEVANSESEKQVEGLSDDAMRQLLQYPWPGNVDELLMLIRDIHHRASGPIVAASDLPSQVRLGIDADESPIVAPETIQLDEFMESVERELITRAMRQAGGNKAQAARLLGIHRARLLRRLTHFEMNE